MLHEPLRAVGRQSTFLHAVQHGGVSCMGVTNPSLALSGHARQFRAETLCSAKRGKGKGVRGPLPHGGWGRVLDFILTHVLLMWLHYVWYRIKIRSQINMVPTPTVAWTRA